MQTFSVQPVSLPPATMNVREQVRALVARAAAAGHRMGLPNSWTAADPAFSRMLGAAGLLGITWPRKYGGGERSALERYVVLEELLAAGAPVGYPWLAERQTAALLLRYGREAQRGRRLPGMAAEELQARTVMREPGAGPGLAAG